MAIVNLTLPLHSFERLIKNLERIAEACERAYPPLRESDDPTYQEPTSGVTIVSNEMLLEEEVRAELRSKGFMPDDIEAMINETETSTQ